MELKLGWKAGLKINNSTFRAWSYLNHDLSYELGVGRDQQKNCGPYSLFSTKELALQFVRKNQSLWTQEIYTLSLVAFIAAPQEDCAEKQLYRGERCCWVPNGLLPTGTVLASWLMPLCIEFFEGGHAHEWR